MVIFQEQSVCHHIQSETPYLGQDGNLIQTACFIIIITHKAGNVTDRPVARWIKIGSVTRVTNGRRNIKHIYFIYSC